MLFTYTKDSIIIIFKVMTKDAYQNSVDPAIILVCVRVLVFTKK